MLDIPKEYDLQHKSVLFTSASILTISPHAPLFLFDAARSKRTTNVNFEEPEFSGIYQFNRNPK